MRLTTRRAALVGACGVLAPAIIVGCATPGAKPLVNSGKLALQLTDVPITPGSSPFSRVVDARPEASRTRVNTPFGERYGDDDFVHTPLDALRTELTEFAKLRLYSKPVFDELGANSLELVDFEASYAALSPEQVDALLAKQQVPAFWLLDRGVVALTGRQGTVTLKVAVLYKGRRFESGERFQVAGEVPPGSYFFVAYMKTAARKLLAKLVP